MFPEVKAFVSHRESIAKVSESQKGVSEGVAEFKPCLDPALFLAFRRPHSAMAFAHPSPPISSTGPPHLLLAFSYCEVMTGLAVDVADGIK